MANQTQPRPRPRRRRSSCPPFLWILILAWGVMMVGRNIVRVMMLPDVRPPPKGPSHYDILGVTPMVNDTTLRRMRKQYNAEYHPDKTKNAPADTEKFLAMQEAFDTLSDGRRRCEYDKENGIRGLWLVQTCRDAFREEYMQTARQEWARYWEIKEAENKKIAEKKKIAENKETKENKTGKPEPSNPDHEPERNVKAPMPKTGEPASRTPESESSWVTTEEEWSPRPEPEARPAVPVATAEHETQDAVEVLTSGVARFAEAIVKFCVEAKTNISAKWEQFASYFDWINRIRLARDYEIHEKEEL